MKRPTGLFFCPSTPSGVIFIFGGNMQITDKFEIVLVAEIKADERNARKHSDEQLMELRRSLREVGFVNPLLLDKDKKIIAGRGRLVAMA